MIRYSLKCEAGHGFDSWFASDTAYASLSAAGQVTCPVCGAVRVEKSLMAPAVRPARKAAGSAPAADDAGSVALPPSASPSVSPSAPPSASRSVSLSTAETALEQALAALRRQVEQNSEYVGMNFAAEARRMHDGDAPERAIYGEARPEDARKLLEDGVPVAPLPFLPTRKAN